VKLRRSGEIVKRLILSEVSVASRQKVPVALRKYYPPSGSTCNGKHRPAHLFADPRKSLDFSEQHPCTYSGSSARLAACRKPAAAPPVFRMRSGHPLPRRASASFGVVFGTRE